MRIDIAAVGRLKAGPERQIYEKYLERAGQAGKAAGLGPFHLTEFNESKAQSAPERMKQEGAKLLEKGGSGALLIALDEKGKNLTSRQFSEKLQRWRDDGTSSICFIIGGADGLVSDVKQRASQLLSLGAMTLPHGIARILLAEQLYRAITIINGHPYHRD